MHGAVTQRLGQNLGLASSVKDSLRLITVAFLLSPKIKIKTGLKQFLVGTFRFESKHLAWGLKCFLLISLTFLWLSKVMFYKYYITFTLRIINFTPQSWMVV